MAKLVSYTDNKLHGSGKCLNWVRLPGRLDISQTAALLGFQEHDIPVLISTNLLKPLGNPAPNASKYFAACELERLTQDSQWLHKATKAIADHWRKKNELTKPDRHPKPRHITIVGVQSFRFCLERLLQDPRESSVHFQEVPYEIDKEIDDRGNPNRRILFRTSRGHFPCTRWKSESMKQMREFISKLVIGCLLLNLGTTLKGGSTQVFTNRVEFEAALGSFIIESFEGAPLNGSIESGSVGAVETLELPYFTLNAEPRAIEILDEDTPFGPRNTTPGGSRYLGFDTSGFFSGIDGELEFLLSQPVFAFGLDYTSHHPENTTAHFRVYGTGDTFIGNFRLRPGPIPLNAPQDGFWGIISSTPIAGLEFDAGDADAIWGVDEVTFTSIPVLACPCEGPADGGTWRSRGEYLGCVRDAAQSMVRTGELSREQQKHVLKSAAASECGKK